MHSAHLLLQADAGRADDVAAFVQALPGCTGAVVTTGPYDVIAVVDLTDAALDRLVHRAKRAPGVSDVRVCTSPDVVRLP
ncbi:MAG: hypothetical protein JWN17_408 [Frankiales bacterium]|nr:hypothetical protein [Frankiales bacterium]